MDTFTILRRSRQEAHVYRFTPRSSGQLLPSYHFRAMFASRLGALRAPFTASQSTLCIPSMPVIHQPPGPITRPPRRRWLHGRGDERGAFYSRRPRPLRAARGPREAADNLRNSRLAPSRENTSKCYYFLDDWKRSEITVPENSTF